MSKISNMKYLIALFIIISTFFKGNAQCDTSKNIVVTLEITTDSFPKENGWILSANDNSKFYGFTPSGTYTEPLKKYSYTYCVPKGQCLRLFLTDSEKNGIEYPGNISVFVNQKRVSYITYFLYSYNEYINCAVGETCGTPETISEGNFTTKFPSQFYDFTPKKNGYYKISTCDSTNQCDTKIWVYEECRESNPSNSNIGTILFNDNDNGCGKYAILPKSILEKNVPYVIRIGGDSCANKPIKWSIYHAGEISGCMDTASCNFNPLASIPTNDCIPQNSPLCKGPDLTLEREPIVQSMYMDEVDADKDPCLVNEGCLSGLGKRKVLRFDTKIKNIGDQDFYIGKPYANPSQFVFDNCHQHYHYRGYAEYLLFDDKGNRIPVGFKAGFCVLDFECKDTTAMKYSCANMGLSPRCTDIYEKELDCQWIDITTIPEGRYTFVARVNWDNSPDKLGHTEARNDNNWAQVCMDIKRQKDSVWFVLDTTNCQEYKDCKGIKYGASVNDCKGICAGKTLHGDLNNSNSQDQDDVLRYMKQAINQGGTATPCDDLNVDGRISITDAAMLSSCMNKGKRHLHDGSSSFHDHCRFPQVVVNQVDTVFFKIQNYNPVGKYFDVAMYNPNTHVNAYQLKFTGVEIGKVQSLVDSTKYNAKPIFGLNTRIVASLNLLDSTIRKSPSYKPLLRVHFLNQATTKVEIEAINDVTDRDGFTVMGKVEGSSIFVSSNKDMPLMNLNVSIQPHPVTNTSYLTFYNPENEVFQLEIFDISGQSMMKIKDIRQNEIELSTEQFASGLYVYKLSGGAGFASGKMVVQK